MNPIDVFDDLRPDTRPLDSATADRVWELILARHPELDETAGLDTRRQTGDSRLADVSDPMVPNRVRRAAWVGAAAAAVVGLIAIASVMDQRSSVQTPAAATPPDTAVPSTAVTSSIDPVVADATAEERTTDESTTIDSDNDDLAAATGFILPGFVPDGWKVAELAAGRSVDTWGNPFGATRWAKVVNGTIEKFLSVRPPSPVEPGVDVDAEVTVRDAPAEVFTQNTGQIGVMWNESGYRISATATGLTEAELLDAMNALVIDLDNQTVSLPDGGASLGLVPESELGFVDGDVITSKVALAHPGVASDTIFAVATPNTFGLSVDGSLPDVPGWETLNVDGIDMRILDRSSGQSTSTELRWIDGEIRYEVHGTVDTDTLVEFARQLTLTDATTFKSAVAALADEETATMMTWAELDRVTFDDGVTATVRSRSTGSGASAICIEAPVQRCREQVSEATLTGSYADNVFDTFNVDGRNLVIGWQSTSEAERLGDPIIEPGDTLNPGDGLGTATTATVDQLVAGTSGRFVEIEVPSGQRPPRLSFRSGTSVIFDAGAPPIRSDYQY